MQRKKWGSRIRAAAAVLSVVLCGASLYCGQAVARLPDSFSAAHTTAFTLAGNPMFTVVPEKQQIRLWGSIPVGTVEVRQTPRTKVTLCGTLFGVKMYTDGAFVVELGEVDGAGGACSPAKAAGLQVGDIIREVNGQKVTSNRDASALISACGGKKIRLTVERNGEVKQLTMRPVFSQSCNAYKAGLWIKDSCAGIGTLTFVTEDGAVAGLGHGITDQDTNSLMPVEYGLIVPATLSGVTKGLRGSPGELKGYFASNDAMGEIHSNSSSGVFGTVTEIPDGTVAEVAFRQEVHRGQAQILSTVIGTTPKWYDVEIERISYDKSSRTQNMVVHITDPELLRITGGIVQGMSGSPIVQDGRLIGAVTHVFIGDPTRGYGVFAENMLDAAS